MASSKRNYSKAEKDLALNMFNRAKAAGTLKSPRIIGSLALSSGEQRFVSATTVTYRDYLREARQSLKARRLICRTPK